MNVKKKKKAVILGITNKTKTAEWKKTELRCRIPFLSQDGNIFRDLTEVLEIIFWWSMGFWIQVLT